MAWAQSTSKTSMPACRRLVCPTQAQKRPPSRASQRWLLTRSTSGQPWRQQRASRRALRIGTLSINARRHRVKLHMAAHSTSRDFRSRNDITCLILKRGVCIASPVRCWLHAALLYTCARSQSKPCKVAFAACLLRVHTTEV
jgi:hypothetical protein